MSIQTMLVAKPIDKEFWILQENNIKIGNVLVTNGRYQVKINNQITEYQNQDSVESAIGVKLTTTTPTSTVTTIRGYHTGSEAFNQTWDVSRGLPLFTKVPSGQCWHAAGWYRMNREGRWVTQECPKLIYLQRYPYEGPFLTKREAENVQKPN